MQLCCLPLQQQQQHGAHGVLGYGGRILPLQQQQQQHGALGYGGSRSWTSTPRFSPSPCLWQNGPHGIIWEAPDIALATGGRLISHGLPGSISIDSRTLQIGEWFLALVGPRFDGHDFLHHAYERGCSGVVANHVPPGWNRGFVQLEGSTLKALQQLASSVRRRYKRPVVAITGSSGKTTTRLMTALALESLGHIHQTEGNLNNHIGVPLSLLKLPSFAAACVLELGMNHEGEILELADLAQPTVRVVLNVGPAHMENFGTLEDIARAKGEMFVGAKEGDLCVMNADDPLVMGMNLPRGVKRTQIHLLLRLWEYCKLEMLCLLRVVAVQEWKSWSRP